MSEWQMSTGLESDIANALIDAGLEKTPMQAVHIVLDTAVASGELVPADDRLGRAKAQQWVIDELRAARKVVEAVRHTEWSDHALALALARYDRLLAVSDTPAETDGSK